MDPCQTVQQIADYASPAGSVSPSVQGQSGGAVQRQGRGTIDGYRRSSFRAFAR